MQSTLTCNFLPSESPNIRSSSSFRIVQWNIERAYKLPQIIQILKDIDADILCLQELDIGCDRSGNVDSFHLIAESLQLAGVFVTEFHELHSPLRSKHTQGGGLHGNAILSRWPITEHFVINHFPAYDWNERGNAKREPRRGNRVTLAAVISMPAANTKETNGTETNHSFQDSSSFTSILAYSCHLEVFTGIYGRLVQFVEVLKFAHEHASRFPCQILCGDMNTLAHSIARFSRAFCKDHLRWRSLGQSEAEWWHVHVLRNFTRPNPFLARYHSARLPCQTIQWAVNPGFWDPFPVNETTLSVLWGIYRSRLDWMLCRGLRVRGRGLENENYAASDHKAMYVDCEVMEQLDWDSVVAYAKQRMVARQGGGMHFGGGGPYRRKVRKFRDRGIFVIVLLLIFRLIIRRFLGRAGKEGQVDLVEEEL